jgi:hypothetical protein
METFDDCGVWYDDHDRMRRDSFGSYESPEHRHWRGFTPEQQRKIRENTPEGPLSEAIRGYHPRLWDKVRFALREAARAFLVAWRGM